MGYFEDLNPSKGIPFMDGRDKGDNENLIGKRWHIDDFGFITGDNGEFAVVSFAEDNTHFYFMNSIITEMLQTVSKDAMRKQLSQVAIEFMMKTSKKDREYMSFEFHEDEIPF